MTQPPTREEDDARFRLLCAGLLKCEDCGRTAYGIEGPDHPRRPNAVLCEPCGKPYLPVWDTKAKKLVYY